jgi:hypothetical protein
MPEFSSRYRFAEWPNPAVPLIAVGCYAVWEGQQLIYYGMSGRTFSPTSIAGKKKYGLYNRLESHASGRLSGDQFCAYVANRIVLPSLSPGMLPSFKTGEISLDFLTKQYIHSRLEYQFTCVSTSTEAFALEQKCRRGVVFGTKPLINPA